MCVYIIVHDCRTQYITAQNNSDNFHSYPPDNHHSSDNVYWREVGELTVSPASRGPSAIAELLVMYNDYISTFFAVIAFHAESVP